MQTTPSVYSLQTILLPYSLQAFLCLFLANYSVSLFFAIYPISLSFANYSIVRSSFHMPISFHHYFLFLIHISFFCCAIPLVRRKVIYLNISYFKSSFHQSVSISTTHSTPSHLYSQALSIYLSIHFFHDISRFLSSLSRFNLHTQLALPRYLAQFLSFLWLCGAASASLAPPPSPCTPHRHPAGTYPHPSSFAYPHRHTFTRVSVNHVWLHGSSLHLHR